MIDPLSGWKARLLAMKPVGTAAAGAQNLADFYGDQADKVTAEGSGLLFTFNRAIFVSTLLASGFTPTGGTEWVQKIGAAFLAGVTQGTIKPAQKNDARWTASGADIITPGSGAAVIITASAAKDTLEAGLLSATAGFQDTEDEEGAGDSQEQFAKAWRDATLEFSFLLIGLIIVGGPSTAPLPLTFNAK